MKNDFSQLVPHPATPIFEHKNSKTEGYTLISALSPIPVIYVSVIVQKESIN